MPRIATDIDDLNVSPAPPYNDESPISPASSSRSSFEKSRKPLTEFEHDPMKIEDMEADAGFERKPRRPRRQSWWRHMALRATGTRYTDDLSGEPSPGVLSDIYPMEPRRRAKRNWFNYLVFGGISGCTILMFLLIINLVLGVATLFWSEDIDRILSEWGRPGSGTEDLAWYPTDFTRDIVPIPCHSHNDYWRRVPLFSALRAGCTGVEADVWLFDEDLYVGHNTASLTRNRTFQSLYVHPLVELLTKQNPNTDFYNGTNHGVFDTDPGKSLTLLVDVKTSGAETWPWVLAQLEPLRERGWLTYVEDGNVHTRPVTVVGTGNTPFDLLTANNSYRDAFFDAPLNDMWEAKETPTDWPAFDDSAPGESFVEDEGSWEETARSASTTSSTLPATKLKDVGQGHSGISDDTSFNSTNSYYASVSFNRAVGHMWRGRLSPRQMKIIRGQIRGAHRRGLKARYWDLPSWPLGLRNHVWDVLVREGVDMLNVDDLRAASRQVW